jgi:hypothetical protein
MDDGRFSWTPEYCRRMRDHHYNLATAAAERGYVENYIHHLREAEIWDRRSKQVKQ